MNRVRVIACGTVDAADDGVGVMAVRSARPALEGMPGVDVAEAGTGDAVVDLLQGIDTALLVDAVRMSGAHRPGRVVRSSGGPDELPASVAPVLSTHGLGVIDAVRLAAALGRRPHVSFVGVEIADTTPGHPMTAPVAEAVPRLAEVVVLETGRLVEAVVEAGGKP